MSSNLPDDFSWAAFDRYFGDDQEPEFDDGEYEPDECFAPPMNGFTGMEGVE